MKHFLMIITLIAFMYPLKSQPVLDNAENFSTGTKLTFVKCESKDIKPGESGPNKTWDFKNLILTKDSVIEDMILPEKTEYGKDFPEATLVEKYSSGNYVFLKHSAKESYLMGFVNPAKNIHITYPKNVIIARRPITYGDKVKDGYSESMKIGNMNLNGTGTVEISADGYGTLILPIGTFKNCLRIKIEQTSIDTVGGSSYTSTTKIITYTWFNDNFTSALLKISNYEVSNGRKDTSVEYLLSEKKDK